MCPVSRVWHVTTALSVWWHSSPCAPLASVHCAGRGQSRGGRVWCLQCSVTESTTPGTQTPAYCHKWSLSQWSEWCDEGVRWEQCHSEWCTDCEHTIMKVKMKWLAWLANIPCQCDWSDWCNNGQHDPSSAITISRATHQWKWNQRTLSVR